MRGLPEFNFPAFHAAAVILRDAGWEVFNPAEEMPDTELEIRQYMEHDLALVCKSDVVFVLPGWEESEGAKLEVYVAHSVGTKVFDLWGRSQIHPPSVEGNYEFSNAPPTSVRQFDTGATRNNDADALDFEGFLSPVVLRRFAEYMHEHRFQSDGQVRDSDNWQKGMPKDAYMKSLLRHVMDLWLLHRGHEAREDIEKTLCAVLFNAQGYLHEELRG